jgi:5-methyltetrahydrofolate--homocysteine methyltransferase
MEQLNTIYNAVLNGDAKSTQAGVLDALDAGIAADTILKQGLIAAMAEVGRLFEIQEYFVPEMLISARAMQSGLAYLKPKLVESGANPAGRIIIGTVKGDLHDIGKNLVAMMMEGAGFEVIDLGTDVSPEKFVEAIQEYQPALVGMSALLTTTMPSMATTIKTIESAGLRNRVKIIVGGAPLTDQYSKSIAADGFGQDASAAVRLAKSLLNID